VKNAEPVAQRLICVLENRPGQMREAVGDAPSAIHALPLIGHRFEGIDVLAAAARAKHLSRPAVLNEISDAGFFVGELPLELGKGELVNALAGHDKVLPCVNL